MASKTSLFNKTILKKDLTRFAPLWGGYTLLIVLSVYSVFSNTTPSVNFTYSLADHLNDCMLAFADRSALYASIAAALLFKDLFNTRLCYTLHSLPVSRNAMFGSHILSGFLFQLIPTTVMALVSLPILLSCSDLNGAPYISLAAWAASNLQYLFFFGLAALCMVCVGNLLGFVAMYGLLNVAGYGAYALLDNLFRPLLKGVVTPELPFQLLTPIFHLVVDRYDRYITIDRVINEATLDGPTVDRYQVLFSTGWPRAVAIAAVGLILIAMALLIYRRRNLETAGEFVSYKLLRPLALLSISLASGTVAALLLVPYDSRPLALRLLSLFLGMALGYFLGLMLLNRSTRVFCRKNWAGLGLLLASMALLLGLTKLDPLGFVTRIPASEKIASVSLTFQFYDRSLDSPEEIDDMRLLHSLAIEETLSDPSDSNIEAYIPFRLAYNLKNGAHIKRTYKVHMDSEAGKLLCKHLSSLKFVLHDPQIKTSEDLLAQVHRPSKIQLSNGVSFYLSDEYLTEETVEALFKALIADCQEGTMVQDSDYHPPVLLSNKESKTRLSCCVYIYNAFERVNFRFRFYSDSRNILAWLDTVGIDSATFWDCIVK